MNALNRKDPNRKDPNRDAPNWIASRISKTCRLIGLVPFFAAAFLAVSTDGSAQTIVGLKVNGKNRNEYGIWFTSLSFKIKITSPGIAAPPAPTLTIDLYDEDDVTGDDGRDIDLTEASAAVSVSAWRLLGPAGAGSRWDCLVTAGGVVENDVTDPLPGDWPDPRVEVIVTVGTAPPVTADLSAPGLPTVGVADFGVDSPSAIANSDLLTGEPISALSRGYDDISRLPQPGFGTRLNQAALYFACEHASPVPASDGASGPGRIFVMDAAGDLWPEDLYAANYDSSEAVLGTPRYLNVNTTAVGGQSPTDEIYFVRQGTDEILYSPSGDPSAASPYLDVSTPRGLAALAVEDLAPRGVWGPGDRILYVLEDSTAIHSLTFGGAPGLLYSLGGTGSPEIGFDHFDQDLPRHSSLRVGSIRALAVSSPGRETPEPSDRILPDVVDYNGLFTYGPADGGQIGFRNDPVLGASDFQVTLSDAAQGSWAMLYVGSPIPEPGVSLPPSLSSSRVLLDLNTLAPVYSATETVSGAGALTLPIPMAPGLIGAEFGFQWVVFMPMTLPVTLSDAGVVYLR